MVGRPGALEEDERLRQRIVELGHWLLEAEKEGKERPSWEPTRNPSSSGRRSADSPAPASWFPHTCHRAMTKTAAKGDPLIQGGVEVRALAQFRKLQANTQVVQFNTQENLSRE
jgi:hypothetical protein